MDDRRQIVSVIIPTYNNASSIKATIASARAQNELGNAGLEIIVIDDASTDATPEILSRLRREMPNLKVVRHEENRGVSAARNTGIREATGDFMAFLDGDDTWHKRKLELQLCYLMNELFESYDALHEQLTAGERPEIDDQTFESIDGRLRNTFSLSYFLYKFPDGVDVDPKFVDETHPEDDKWHPKIYSKEELLRGAVEWSMWFGIGSTLFAHREAIHKNGFFNEALGCGEDTEYLTRHILNGGRINVVPYPLMTYRMPERSKPYRGQDIHYQWMVDTYRCRIAQRFGPESAKTFLAKIRGFHEKRAAPGEAWHGAAHELTVLPNAPCESGFACSLEGNICHRPDSLALAGKKRVVEATAGL